MIFIGDAQGELSFKKAPPKNHYGRTRLTFLSRKKSKQKKATLKFIIYFLVFKFFEGGRFRAHPEGGKARKKEWQ